MLNSIRWRWPALALLAGAVFAGCAGLDAQQRKWIFMATATPALSSPAERDDGMADVWIEHRSTESGATVKLHGLWLAHDNPAAPVLLYLHGARRNIEASSFRIRQMRDLGFSVLAAPIPWGRASTARS